MQQAERALELVSHACRVAVFACVLTPSPAGAEEARARIAPATAEPSSTAEQAKLRYEQGKVAYREGRYADAIQAFSEADARAPRAALCFDIARAHERLGEPSRAVDAYREYLRRAPDAPNADLVRARISALEAEMQATAAAAPEPRVATAPVVTPVPARNEAASTRHADAKFAPWSWVTLATGGALLASAGVVELMRRDAESEARAAPTQLAYADDYQRMRSYQSAARVLAGVGGALAVTGGVLVAIDLGRGRRAETRVGCGPNGCFGRFEGAF
jgi:tetratricopeptide (TPR) repeat protein